MAAKKTTPKTSSAKKTAKPKAKTAAKPAAKPANKTATASKKPAAAPEAKEPAKKAVKKVSAKSAAKSAASAKTAPAKAAPAKAAKANHKAAPAAKTSSLTGVAAPPPPVKPPFVPKKSDEHKATGTNGSHSSSFIQKQRQRLLDLRDELVDSMSGMTRDTIRNAPEGSEASGSGQHQGDAGSDAYDRDFALSVLAKEQDALYEIEQALRRIQVGAYGICEMSAKKIPQARLEAIPFARLTVECQAQWEKEYGNRRFRPTNEVGFSGGNYGDDEDSDTVSLDEDDD